ncbi:DUF7665 family protein [Microvirga zambiensis]|uniref:DUF7665 family protein n=1 Tax=Microvirga zambiensis TaxID=1402137 RepID=UPI00191D733B|nr:hypothetical protein [Microvirga zambiensis]
MTPDRAALERDLAAPLFREGGARKRWRLIEIAWPYVLIGVTARDGREFVLRLECCGYPAQPPTGGFWNQDRGAYLDLSEWPKGDDVFQSVIRWDWRQGAALYFPLDRVSRTGHECWAASHPHLVWNPTKGIVQYVAEVHRLLNSRGYRGIT